MLKDDYDINIIGRQAYEEETGEITLNTTGSYTQRGGTRFIAYKESVSYTHLAVHPRPAGRGGGGEDPPDRCAGLPAAGLLWPCLLYTSSTLGTL